MESWDDDNFEPPAPATVPVHANKWEGEDEEEDVKESWEDEDEEKKEEMKQQDTDLKKPRKKTLQEKITEKERLKREEMEKRLREQEEEEISSEERLRRQKESDLKIALETTFGGDKVSSGIGDLDMPNTKEEFENFADVLSKKLTPLSKNIEYPTFIENLTRNLCATMSSIDIKRIKNSLDNLYLEKQKIEKGEKTKKNKGKGKAKLKMEGDNQLSQLSAYVNDFDDYDDFM
ncbi:eukaryotic translation initiation factor 3 subunit J [Anoplophora glabripennis]|uniref:eukaryotic translation initiation factor 3 subunit J n=1 Tax=Anoplophora glabripennis TaxID=217634 RepID=UPI000873CD5B|nr:eukaryotic translation initiation factor 3 subunit J [Anoplophora glabripennis]